MRYTSIKQGKHGVLSYHPAKVGAIPAVFSTPPIPPPSYAYPPIPSPPSPNGLHGLPGALKSSHSHRLAVANSALAAVALRGMIPVSEGSDRGYREGERKSEEGVE